MSLVRPESSEYAPFYAGYVARVPEDDILSVLQRQGEEIRDLARSLPAAKETYRYADGKWSIREVLGHLIDGERVFGYRAFCFSRGEQAPLPSFDENQYVAGAGADQIPAAELGSEFAAVRASNLAFLRRLSAADAKQLGTASGNPISVRALAYIMAGHPRHHLAVLRERYGVA
ncbi:MAG: DinB family protein [Burkholderiales bacterium]|jgi:transposase